MTDIIVNKEQEAAAAFAGYTQSVAFSLTLSRNMIEVLAAIRDRGPLFHSTGPLSRSASSHFVPVGHSLMRRGLVYHVQSQGRLTDAMEQSGIYGWHLSEAGKKVCEMLVIAGLIDAQKPKAKRRAA